VLLAALCGGSVLGAREAVSGWALPALAIAAGGIAASVAFAAVLWLRPQALGNEAQLALARIVPRFSSRLARTPAL
jgi:hypothetical protein